MPINHIDNIVLLHRLYPCHRQKLTQYGGGGKCDTFWQFTPTSGKNSKKLSNLTVLKLSNCQIWQFVTVLKNCQMTVLNCQNCQIWQFWEKIWQFWGGKFWCQKLSNFFQKLSNLTVFSKKWQLTVTMRFDPKKCHIPPLTCMNLRAPKMAIHHHHLVFLRELFSVGLSARRLPKRVSRTFKNSFLFCINFRICASSICSSSRHFVHGFWERVLDLENSNIFCQAELSIRVTCAVYFKNCMFTKSANGRVRVIW